MKRETKIAIAMAAWCLVLAAVEFDAYWPYQLSRWALCAGAIWLAFQHVGWRRGVLAVLAVIYNPIAPVYFRDAWPVVNVVSAVALAAVALRGKEVAK